MGTKQPTPNKLALLQSHPSYYFDLMSKGAFHANAITV